MGRMFAICITWSIVALSVAHAVPARPLYEPQPPPQLVLPKQVLVMGGTTWLGKYNTLNRYFTFELDGTVSYSSSPTAKGIKNRGTWKVEGNTFFFDHHIGTNNKVMEYRGTFQDSNTIVGENLMLKTGVKTNVIMKKSPFLAK